jgi:hypothetical protein
MGQITITKTFTVGGSAQNATSFKIGVTRNDTNGVVVASGTDMTNTGIGVYTYTFTEPAAGLTYTASYEVTYGSSDITWSEPAGDNATTTVDLPALTGDVWQDTFNSLIWQRLQVIRLGPKVSYEIHGHKVLWNEWLRDLDGRIAAIMKQMAQVSPLESVGIGI